MKAQNNQYKNVVVNDGHPASFRNVDGSVKNIYANDGNLTNEGKEVMAAREALSHSNKENKQRKKNKKLTEWAVSAAVIVFFLLFFHISLVTAYENGLPKIYSKASPTFSNTFITPTTVQEIIERHNNASIFERPLIKNEPFVKLLFDKGILFLEGD